MGNGMQDWKSDTYIVRVVLAIAALDVVGNVYAELRIPENAHALAGVMPEVMPVVVRDLTNHILCHFAVDRRPLSPGGGLSAAGG